MSNSDTQVAKEYHEATKHSEVSVRTSTRRPDLENKPRSFKIYTSLPQKPLLHNFPLPSLNALECIGMLEAARLGEQISAGSLAAILFFAAGITRTSKYAHAKYYMRAASATGALYPIELYVVCGSLGDVEAGVYHFGPGDFVLTQLRRGDFRGYLDKLAGGRREVLLAPSTIIFTSLAWRNAWKYEARSYRHWFWDAGVIASNLLAACVSLGFKTELLMGFDDSRVSRLLGLKEEKEAPIVLAPIGAELSHSGSKRIIEPDQISPPYLPISKEEVDYPIIWRMNDSSSLSEREVEGWAKPVRTQTHRNTGGSKSFKITPESPEPGTPPSLGEVILARGSTRRFARKPVSFAQVSTTLYHSTRGIPADFLNRSDSLVDTYLIANSVEGLTSGTYYFDRVTWMLNQLKAGEFRSASSFLCLEQPLFGDASVVFFLMADLESILSSLGNRGYRAAQFEAGVTAGKIYLSAYAQKIGASGSTFYDDYVTDFFSPHAAGKTPMIAVGVGIPAYTARPGRILAGKLRHEDILLA